MSLGAIAVIVFVLGADDFILVRKGSARIERLVAVWQRWMVLPGLMALCFMGFVLLTLLSSVLGKKGGCDGNDSVLDLELHRSVWFLLEERALRRQCSIQLRMDQRSAVCECP